uniref:Uncharacterized protein n=1 Tax=Tanacetum cinerariifolium TaxID=118510 RepID=A0A6L2LMG9_TANCI|nr:hypothetical protein [Tanacetum cinerariifolium]
MGQEAKKEKVLNEVKLRIFQNQFWKKPHRLGNTCGATANMCGLQVMNALVKPWLVCIATLADSLKIFVDVGSRVLGCPASHLDLDILLELLSSDKRTCCDGERLCLWLVNLLGDGVLKRD